MKTRIKNEYIVIMDAIIELEEQGYRVQLLENRGKIVIIQYN